jgi:hypothetical protein
LRFRRQGLAFTETGTTGPIVFGFASILRDGRLARSREPIFAVDRGQRGGARRGRMGQNGGEQEILSRARGREGRERVFVLEMIAQRREFNGASVLLPVGGEAMMVQLSQCDSGGGGGGVRFVRGRVDLDFVLIHHEKEALLGSRQLRNVVAWMSAPDMLLHRAKAFFLELY